MLSESWLRAPACAWTRDGAPWLDCARRFSGWSATPRIGTTQSGLPAPFVTITAQSRPPAWWSEPRPHKRTLPGGLRMPPSTRLYSLEEALAMDWRQNVEHHRRHLNHRYVKLARLVRMERVMTGACGSYFWDGDGVRYLDFLSGFAAL